MSTFSVWLQAYTKDKTPKRVTWVCGSERVLVDDVVSATLAALDLRPWSEHRLVMGEAKESELWELAMQYPLELEDRVIVVHSAEKIKNWAPLKNFLTTSKKNPTTHLIFVSNSDRAEKTPGNRQEDIKPELLPHLKLIQAKGRIVECKKFTQATYKYAIAWIQARAAVTPLVAKHILLRTNGDLESVKNICAKAAVIPIVTNQHINLLASETPTDTFADALMVLDRKTALRSLQTLSDDEAGDALRDLSYRLDEARAVHDMIAERKTKTEIRAMLQSRGKAFLVDHLMDVSKYYNRKRGLEVRRVLDAAIRSYESGAREGVLESVIAVW